MNPSFDFYIVDLNRGSITGTNNRDIAEDFAASDDFYVIDVNNNLDLLNNSNIEEFKA
jgi:predicted Fe-Mo cluster-binding NifX family protein